MTTTYKILENLNKGGILTIKIESDQLSFNHTLTHKNDEFEEFAVTDIGCEIINDNNIYHINGYILTNTEFKFITSIIREL